MIPSAKVMLLGDIAVGKTSLAKRLVFDRFDADYKTTIGVNVLSHEARVSEGDDGLLRLVIWEIPFLGFDFSMLRFVICLPMGIVAGIIARRLARQWGWSTESMVK